MLKLGSTLIRKPLLSRLYSQKSDASEFRFIERPFTPENWLKMSISALQKLPKHKFMASMLHNVNLMDQQIIPFSYDYFVWSCWRMVEQQQDLRKDDIFLMLRLGNKYKITIAPFHLHMENELFLRIHRDYELQIRNYDQKITQQMSDLLQSFEAKSKDYFNLLSNAGIEAQSPIEPIKPQITQQVTISKEEKLIEDLSKEHQTKSPKKQISLTDLLQISDILHDNGSKNVRLLQYLTELLTIKFESLTQISIRQMLVYIRLLTDTCQNLMQQYSSNKHKYTPRSIKQIYKYQGFYYHEHFRQLEMVKSKLNDQQLQQLVQSYTAFPIKMRSIRRKIGGFIGSEFQKRNLVSNNELVNKLLEVNRKDIKMRRFYGEALGLPKDEQINQDNSQISKEQQRNSELSQREINQQILL